VRVCFLRRAYLASKLACSGPRTPLRKQVAASLQHASHGLKSAQW